MSTVYLSFASSGIETLARHTEEGPVDLLVAYPALKDFLRTRHRFNINKWVLDSGAYSVMNSGKSIDLKEYIAAARDVDAVEIFGLDVIGDTAQTQRNCNAMWSAGVDAIPTFHYGEAWPGLKWCCENADKIALGGIANKRGNAKFTWLSQCFARAWPKKIHGFGIASWEGVRLAPFHSVDASSWTYAPARFGRFAGYGGKQKSMYTKGVTDYWIEVEEHRKRAAWATARWRRELAMLETLAPMKARS